MMLDDDVAAASPATVYRVLKSADRLRRPSPANERKGKGFHQPGRPHRHWHIDFSHAPCGHVALMDKLPELPASTQLTETFSVGESTPDLPIFLIGAFAPT